LVSFSLFIIIFLGGIFLMLLIAVIAIFTVLVLAHFVVKLRQQSYQGLVTHVLGKRASLVCQVLILFYTYGAGIIYLQMVRDNLAVPLEYYLGVHWYTDPRFLITIFTCAFPWPLSYLRNMAKLSYSSTVGILFVVYTVLFVVVDGIIFLANNEAPPIIMAFNPSITFAQGFPNIVFAFMTHVGFVPIAAELMNPTMKRTSMVVSSSFVMCLAVYFAIGLVGYMRIGAECFDSVINPGCIARFPYFAQYNMTNGTSALPPSLTNILNFYPAEYIPATVGRFGMCITLGVGFPISTFVGRLTIQTLFNHNKEFTKWPYFWVTTIWCATTLAFTVGLRSIQVVFTFVGSICGSAFMMVIPSVMLIYNFRDKPLWIVIGVVVAVFGVCAGMTAIIAHFVGQ
jgi:amino acid permease